MDYAYYVQLGGKLRFHDLASEFDPASVSKLFYAVYVVKKFDLDQLAKVKFTINSSQLRKYGRGTRSIRWWNLRSVYSLADLLYLSIVKSCNVATGIIAEFVGRAEVNAFIATELNLTKTSVFSAITPNQTTLSDLLSCLQQITDSNLLTEAERQYLFSLLAQTTRRGVIRQSLPKTLKVYSKGGTTFTGLRRDAAIVFDLQSADPGFIIVIQRDEVSSHYSLLDNLLAKLHLGSKAERLQMLDREFDDFVYKLLTTDAGAA